MDAQQSKGEVVDTNDHSDVVAVVLEQHKAAKLGLAEVLNATGDKREESFRSLAGVLAAHEGAEEAVIYPALRALGDNGVKIADARTREEAAAKETLTKLMGMDTGSADFTDLFQPFMADVLEHATKEEAEVLPLLTASFDDGQRRAMGEAFRAAQSPATSST